MPVGGELVREVEADAAGGAGDQSGFRAHAGGSRRRRAMAAWGEYSVVQSVRHGLLRAWRRGRLPHLNRHIVWLRRAGIAAAVGDVLQEELFEAFGRRRFAPGEVLGFGNV